jgi:hypothetical protein
MIVHALCKYPPCERFPRFVEAQVQRLFKNPEPVLARGGLTGNILLQRLDSGHLFITFVSGPMQMCRAIYLPGYSHFLIGRSQYEVYELPVKVG